jgi:hypothetical protein
MTATPSDQAALGKVTRESESYVSNPPSAPRSAIHPKPAVEGALLASDQDLPGVRCRVRPVGLAVLSEAPFSEDEPARCIEPCRSTLVAQK